MDNSQSDQSKLLNTTDCLEAVGVFRGWKNFLFVIIILILLMLQASFWLVNMNCVQTSPETSAPAVTAIAEKTADPNAPVTEPGKIQAAARQVIAKDSNQPAEPAAKKKFVFNIKPETKHLAWLVGFLNFTLIPTAVLYCLTMLFSLKISLIGRLGGINHIARAFFLSLIFLVLLLPWQVLFNGVVTGAIFTSEEFLNACETVKQAGLVGKILYYLRFTGYWLLVMLLLILSQIRSIRWAKTILRRLEII